jgi:hypothetical protein
MHAERHHSWCSSRAHPAVKANFVAQRAVRFTTGLNQGDSEAGLPSRNKRCSGGSGIFRTRKGPLFSAGMTVLGIYLEFPTSG